MNQNGFKSLLVLIAALCGGGVHSHAQASERIYKVNLWVESGNGNFCVSERFWIREGNGKFRFFDLNNNKELASLPMGADGSVSGEARIPHGSPWRVTVPAGDKPRSFVVIDLRQACRYRVDPMS